jgi:antitoxin PrlF
MNGKNSQSGFCSENHGNGECACTVEAVVPVDSRGQMVLPKDIRERADISPGDRLAVVFWEREEDVCCITLIKAEHFSGMVKTLLTPMMEGISDQKSFIE